MSLQVQAMVVQVGARARRKSLQPLVTPLTNLRKSGKKKYIKKARTVTWSPLNTPHKHVWKADHAGALQWGCTTPEIWRQDREVDLYSEEGVAGRSDHEEAFLVQKYGELHIDMSWNPS